MSSGIERAKHNKHAAAATANNLTYVTWAATTYGGWGDGFLDRHVKPEYAKRLQAEKKAGRSGWAAIRWRQRVYEDMGIELAGANYRMLMSAPSLLPAAPPRVGGWLSSPCGADVSPVWTCAGGTAGRVRAGDARRRLV